MKSEFNIYVTTYQGLEEILLEELVQSKIGSKHEIRKRGVAFAGNIEDVYRANYLVRSALRVLINLVSFELNEANDLYDFGKKVEWDKWFFPQKSIAIDAIVRNEHFKNSVYAAQLLKDAICDRFVENESERPNVDLKLANVRINLLIAGASCTISMDSSGDSLHKRGYKTVSGVAPLSEVLASGILKLSGWDGKSELYDGMCGSGTLLTEAFLLSKNTPCGKYRQKFCFQQWRNFDGDKWKEIKDESKRIESDNVARISGGDSHPYAIEDAKMNIAAASMDQDIDVFQRDFFNSPAPAASGFLIMNPPYDKRITLADAKQFYSEIGDKLKTDYKGWTAAIFSANIPAIKALGLKPKRRIPLWNGPLEGRLNIYELY
ncbi:THUMP domain-containing protein [Salibacteraceae bacterium]|nr:THUMP domain-containing protein [Salibacteraceae bacterium]MDB9725513.1 THUMP domain-containing protein [Salibacteraceae bacterium]MDB9984047.1 THUMP domain-containing protein [bacterium]